jgi:hypothetical protein
MNFLQLCKRLRSESGIPSTGPSTVVGQTGELSKIVEWIQSAYEDIQNLHPKWQFLQESFNFSTVSGTAEYTPTAAGINDLLSWKEDDFRVYLNVSDEIYLVYEPWDTFRPYYNYGSLRTQTEKPTVITVKPNKSLFLWAIPDQAYTIDGQYYKTPDVMENNTDVPIFENNFHMAIVWKGLMYYGGERGAPDAYAHGQAEYKKIIRKLEFDQLPKMTFGSSLA